MGNGPAKEEVPKAKARFPLSKCAGSTESIRSTANISTTSGCKICVMGESQCGKSSVVNWLARKPFVPEHHTTVGAEQTDAVIMSGGHTWKIQLWDSAGLDQFRINNGIFYEGASALVIVVPFHALPVCASIAAT